MHLTVGYLATPTGDDGVALASAIAKTFDADVDVVLVVRQEMPDGHPGRAEYQQLLVEGARSGCRGPSAPLQTGA
jgi:predicted phosphoribosyltransferase